MNLRIVRILAPGLLAAASFAQSMPTYWRLADPDAKILMGLNIKALADSSMAADIKQQFSQASSQALPISLSAIDGGGEITKLLQGVDRVFLSMGEIPQGAAKARLTAAITGEFDLVALRKFLGKQGGVKSVLRGVEVWQGKGTENAMIAIVNPQLLAVGDRASIRKAVSQFAVGDGSVMGTAVYQHAAELARDHDFWIAGEIPPPSAKDKNASPLPSQFADALKSFDVGIRARNGLDMELNLYTDTPENATRLSAMASAFMQLSAAGNQDPQLTSLLSRLKMGTDGPQIQISGSWTQDEIVALSKARLDPAGALPPSALSATNTPVPGTAPVRRTDAAQPMALAVPPRPAEPPKPLKVKIYNPDAPEVREFELKRE